MNLNKILKKDKFTFILFHGVIENNKTSIRNYTNKHIEKKNLKKFLSIYPLKVTQLA